MRMDQERDISAAGPMGHGTRPGQADLNKTPRILRELKVGRVGPVGDAS
jgi:hypothetical protein